MQISESWSLSGGHNYVPHYLPVLPHVPITPQCKVGENELKSTGATATKVGEKPRLGEALFFVPTNAETDSVSPGVQISTGNAKSRENVPHRSGTGSVVFLLISFHVNA